MREPDFELEIRDLSKICPYGVQAIKDVTLTISVGMYGFPAPARLAGMAHEQVRVLLLPPMIAVPTPRAR